MRNNLISKLLFILGVQTIGGFNNFKNPLPSILLYTTVYKISICETEINENSER